MREHRFRILRPEDDAPCLVKSHVERQSIERIEPLHITHAQSANQPIRIKGGNVRRPTSRNNDWRLRYNPLTRRELDVCSRPSRHNTPSLLFRRAVHVSSVQPCYSHRHPAPEYHMRKCRHRLRPRRKLLTRFYASRRQDKA